MNIFLYNNENNYFLIVPLLLDLLHFADENKYPNIHPLPYEKLDDVDIKQNSIIKGDSLSVSIAAASIIAKVTRDRMMVDMDSKYPEYGFLRNKGYGTKEHIEAIRKYGLCPIHRVSFTRNFVD